MKKTYLNLSLLLCLFALPLHADEAAPALEEILPAVQEAEIAPETPLAATETPSPDATEKHVGKAAEDGSLQGTQNDWGKYVVAATVVGAAITAIILVSHK